MKKWDELTERGKVNRLRLFFRLNSANLDKLETALFNFRVYFQDKSEDYLTDIRDHIIEKKAKHAASLNILE